MLLQLPMNKTHALFNLLDAQEVLSTISVSPFLVDGTLLGAIRENTFMDHDKDLDMGVFIEEYVPEIQTKMIDAGFTHHRTFGTPAKGLELAFKKHDIKLDIFFYYREPGTRFHAAWLRGRTLRYDYWDFGLKSLTLFGGHVFRVPDDPVRFLETKYGDWKIPVKEWDWAFGPKNVRYWDG